MIIGKLRDLTGQRFCRLVVIKRDDTANKKHGARWICKCDCGTIKSISSANLLSGATQSCGCLNRELNSAPKSIDGMIGKRFGRLIVLRRAGTHISPSGQKKPTWVCLCDCGNVTTVISEDLRCGHTRSCGCLPIKHRGDGLIDLVGRRFGKLTVLERTDDYISNKGALSPSWLCKCDCGNIVIVQGGNLRSGATHSCGCDKPISKGEQLVYDLLTKNDVRFLREYTFSDLFNKRGKLLRFDFGILDDNNNLLALVEYQGKQHYVDCGQFGLYQRKYSDIQKKKYCESNKIPLYEIRYDDDMENVFNKLLNEIKILQANPVPSYM